MAKLKNPLLSLRASGSLGRILTFVTRRSGQLVEKKPQLMDAKSPAQLYHRNMFGLCKDLWHTLSTAEKAIWESQGTARHMTGYAWYISQCLRPNPGIYLPLAGGTMSGTIDMAGQRIQNLPAPVAPHEPARKAELDALVGGYTAGARVWRNSVQSIPRLSGTAISFNTEDYDTDGIHDNAINNSRLTCKTAGKYLISGQLRFQDSASGQRRLYLFLDNTTYIAVLYLGTTSGNAYAANITTIYDLSIGQYVEFLVWQDSAGNQDVLSTASYTPSFMMQRIG